MEKLNNIKPSIRSNFSQSRAAFLKLLLLSFVYQSRESLMAEVA